MKKQLLIIGITLVLLTVTLSGCTNNKEQNGGNEVPEGIIIKSANIEEDHTISQSSFTLAITMENVGNQIENVTLKAYLMGDNDGTWNTYDTYENQIGSIDNESTKIVTIMLIRRNEGWSEPNWPKPNSYKIKIQTQIESGEITDEHIEEFGAPQDESGPDDGDKFVGNWTRQHSSDQFEFRADGVCVQTISGNTYAGNWEITNGNINVSLWWGEFWMDDTYDYYFSDNDNTLELAYDCGSSYTCVDTYIKQ